MMQLVLKVVPELNGAFPLGKGLLLLSLHAGDVAPSDILKSRCTLLAVLVDELLPQGERLSGTADISVFIDILVSQFAFFIKELHIPAGGCLVETLLCLLACCGSERAEERRATCPCRILLDGLLGELLSFGIEASPLGLAAKLGGAGVLGGRTAPEGAVDSGAGRGDVLCGATNSIVNLSAELPCVVGGDSDLVSAVERGPHTMRDFAHAERRLAREHGVGNSYFKHNFNYYARKSM